MMKTINKSNDSRGLRGSLAGLNSKLGVFLAIAIVCLSGLTAQAQDAVSTITTGVTEIITNGTTVGLAALGIFLAYVGIMVVKKFFFAGK